MPYLCRHVIPLFHVYLQLTCIDDDICPLCTAAVCDGQTRRLGL